MISVLLYRVNAAETAESVAAKLSEIEKTIVAGTVTSSTITELEVALECFMDEKSFPTDQIRTGPQDFETLWKVLRLYPKNLKFNGFNETENIDRIYLKCLDKIVKMIGAGSPFRVHAGSFV